MARYKMKADAGTHVGPDHRWKRGEDGKFTGPDGQIADRAPDLAYGPGHPGGIFVETDEDLLTKAAGKFELVKGEDGDDDARRFSAPTASAPGGQVSEGFQVTTSDSSGRPISGVMTEASQPRTADEKKDDPHRLRKDEVTGKVKATEDLSDPDDEDNGDDDVGDELDSDVEPGKESKAELEAMTVAELRQLANERGINLHGAGNKDEIVSAIRKGS